MESDAAYGVFLGFGIFWIVLGAIAVIAFMRAENLPLRLDQSALIVIIPILIPLIAALVIGVWLS